MKPALSQVCSLNSPFEKDVADYAAGQCQAIEIWLTKLETYLQSHTVNDVRRLLDQHQLSFPVASYQGGLLTSQGESRIQAWNLFGQRLALCQEIGIGTLVVAADIGLPLRQEDVERTRVTLRELAREAGQHGVSVALEFHAQAAFCNNLQTAQALVAEVASPYLGLCFDVFHYYIGPSKLEDLDQLTTDNLRHVQLSDLADVPREFATDSDRILPGDGDFSLEPIIQRLRGLDYDGFVSIELMNPQIWQIPARQFGEIGINALRKVLGESGEPRAVGGERKTESGEPESTLESHGPETHNC